MPSAKSSLGRHAALALAALAALVALAAMPLGALAAPPAPPARMAVKPHTLLQSRLLWATIDVCNTPEQPDTVGIRGSMPGDGQARETMYMRFGLQYMDLTTKHWVDLSNDADAGFLAIGSAKSVRQAGTTFELKPVTGTPAVTLRGVVDFEWRQGTKVVASTSRPTTAGRISLAGAEPAGFSADTCAIG
jgi:hypothetical protein